MLPNKKKIATGGYSLIFHPAIDTKGNEIDDLSYVTKLQTPSYSSDNEIAISKIIREIKNYTYHFSPIVMDTRVDVSVLQYMGTREEFKEVERILWDEKEKGFSEEYVYMMIPYVGSNEFHQHICRLLYSVILVQRYQSEEEGTRMKWRNNPRIQYGLQHIYAESEINDAFIATYPLNQLRNDFIILFIDGFSHILDSISILLDHGIIHHDLKEQNILYNEELTVPILIDFGLSLRRENLNADTYMDYFFVYKPSYFIWSPDIHLINLILHDEQRTLAEFDDAYITQFVDTYLHHAKKKVLFPFFSSKEIETYRENLITYYCSLYKSVKEERIHVPKTGFQQLYKSILCHKEREKDMDYDGERRNAEEVVIEKLLENYKKWDLYSLCITYISMCTRINTMIFEYKKDHAEILHKRFNEEYNSVLYYNVTPFYREIKQLLFEILQPSYHIIDHRKEFTILKNRIQEYICQGL